MRSASDRHGPEHSNLVLDYALQAVSASDVSVVEENLSACADCRQEMEALRPIVDAFLSWPVDVVRPSPALKERLAQRIAAETGREPVMPEPRRWTEPEWKQVASGIFCKLLSNDPERGRVSMLVRLAPGTDYPPHRHAGVEELHLLYGELFVDDKKLNPGDYIRAEAGSSDQRVWSETGCTCFLTTSTQDEIR